jgi:hypothetical protein
MKVIQPHLEKLRAEAVLCETKAKHATDKAKRELFTRLAEHYKVLASEVERAIKQKQASLNTSAD